jgi:hypothetical protein
LYSSNLPQKIERLEPEELSLGPNSVSVEYSSTKLLSNEETDVSVAARLLDTCHRGTKIPPQLTAVVLVTLLVIVRHIDIANRGEIVVTFQAKSRGFDRWRKQAFGPLLGSQSSFTSKDSAYCGCGELSSAGTCSKGALLGC